MIPVFELSDKPAVLYRHDLTEVNAPVLAIESKNGERRGLLVASRFSPNAAVATFHILNSTGFSVCNSNYFAEVPGTDPSTVQTYLQCGCKVYAFSRLTEAAAWVDRAPDTNADT